MNAELRDIPEWEETPEEKIPPALERKWKDDEKRGQGAGVCRSCGYPYLEEELSCRHCEAPLEVSSGFVGDLTTWLLKTPWGVVTLMIIFLAVATLLIASF